MALMTFKNFVNGGLVARGSCGTFEDRNPADHVDLIGVAPRGGAPEVAAGNGHREAGTAALDFYLEWKSVYFRLLRPPAEGTDRHRRVVER